MLKACDHLGISKFISCYLFYRSRRRISHSCEEFPVENCRMPFTLFWEISLFPLSISNLQHGKPCLPKRKISRLEQQRGCFSGTICYTSRALVKKTLLVPPALEKQSGFTFQTAHLLLGFHQCHSIKSFSCYYRGQEINMEGLLLLRSLTHCPLYSLSCSYGWIIVPVATSD